MLCLKFKSAIDEGVLDKAKTGLKDFYQIIKKPKNLIRFLILLISYISILIFFPYILGFIYLMQLIAFYVCVTIYLFRELILRLFLNPFSMLNFLIIDINNIQLIILNLFSPSTISFFNIITIVYLRTNNPIIALISSFLIWFAINPLTITKYHDINGVFDFENIWNNIKANYNCAYNRLINENGNSFHFIFTGIVLTVLFHKQLTHIIKWDKRIKRKNKIFSNTNIYLTLFSFFAISLIYKSNKKSKSKYLIFEEDTESII